MPVSPLNPEDSDFTATTVAKRSSTLLGIGPVKGNFPLVFYVLISSPMLTQQFISTVLVISFR